MDKVFVSSEDALRLIAKSVEMDKYDNALAILSDIGKSVNKTKQENETLKTQLSQQTELLRRAREIVVECSKAFKSRDSEGMISWELRGKYVVTKAQALLPELLDLEGK